MLTPAEPDRTPRTVDKRRWQYLPIANGASTVGYLAAHPCGVWTHHVGGTKPCKRRMTISALVCPYCESGLDPVWRGYTPIYDREYIPRFVLIAADYLESVREIAPNAQIRLSRDKSSRAPVVIRAENWTVKSLPASPARPAEIDLMPFLLRLWKDAELTRWVATAHMPLPGTVAELPPLTERPEDCVGGQVGVKVLEQMLLAERFKRGGKDEPATVGEVLSKPHQNGKPRKPK